MRESSTKRVLDSQKHKNNRTKNKTVKTDNSFMLLKKKKKWTLISMMCNRKDSYLASD